MKQISFEIPNIFIIEEKAQKEKMKELSDESEIKDYSENIISRTKLKKIRGL